MYGESVVRNDTHVIDAIIEIFGDTWIVFALFWKMYRAWIFFDPLRRIDHPIKLLLFPWTQLKFSDYWIFSMFSMMYEMNLLV